MDKLVFIIDDDQVYLSFMKGHFNKMIGYQVETYTEGNEAIKQLSHKNPFLIILDHHLTDPNRDGIFYLRKIKRMKSSVPIIYITSDNSDSIKNEAIKHGVNTVIIKSESFLVQLRTAMDDLKSSPKKGIFSKLF